MLGWLVHAACASMYSLRGKIDVVRFLSYFLAVHFLVNLDEALKIADRGRSLSP